ncbi:hypothetical protein ACO0K2_17445 [Undibacterium sp. MH2W]|uniref:hypothetical protein n=1 Tax=Undibacterium sp. MH2W TaxID=3413044 RepID=UPI003BF381A1
MPVDSGHSPKSFEILALQKDFDSAWSRSFPGGKSQEQGYVLVWGPDGNLHAVNGGSGTTGTFTPNFNVESGYTIYGMFHTHSYSVAEGGYTGVSLSGADIANLINDSRRQISVVQSGSLQFLMLKTEATPLSVNRSAMNNSENAAISNFVSGGMNFSEASRVAAVNTARQNGLAYYEGSNGVFI